MQDQTGYSAPALEKGLDVLETLAEVGTPMTMSEIADRLGRSRSEIFRMIHVLIARGYIVREPVGDTLSLGSRLLSLAIRTPGTRDLVAVATPVITRLAQEIGQTVHLVVPNHGETVVIAAVSGSTDMNFSLKLGYRRPLVDSHSGLLLLAFQSRRAREAMMAESLALVRDHPARRSLDVELDTVLRDGFVARDSRDVVGITDYSMPVLDAGRAIAAINVSYVKRIGTVPPNDTILARLGPACHEVSTSVEANELPAV